MVSSVTFTPIGVVRSPFREKVEAPRQAAAAKGIEARIELEPGRGFEHALEDLEGWDRIWVLFLFDRNEGWRPKVLPPRSDGKRRGVFSTRSPHRPNPIGMSAVELVAVEGLTVRVRDVDILDGTPVLDLKPYVPYADAFPEARAGWLAEDPRASWEVRWGARADEQAAWLRARGIDLVAPVTRALSLGPQPNAYRRIRVDERGARLAVKDWRVRFEVGAGAITVTAIATGYRGKQLAEDADPALDVHRAFVAAFG